MEHSVSKIGTVFAAAVLSVGLPAIASAQDDTTGAPPADAIDTATQVDESAALEMTPISDAISATAEQAQILSGMQPIDAQNVVAVSLADVGLTAAQRYALGQQMDPSAEAMLQQALGTAQVIASTGEQRTLADHLTALGVDPATVVAAEVANDGTVTLYYQ
jgi:hypothetical protein